MGLTEYDIVGFGAKRYVRLYSASPLCNSGGMEKKKPAKKMIEREKQPQEADERPQQLTLFSALVDIWKTAVP